MRWLHGTRKDLKGTVQMLPAKRPACPGAMPETQPKGSAPAALVLVFFRLRVQPFLALAHCLTSGLISGRTNLNTWAFVRRLWPVLGADNGREREQRAVRGTRVRERPANRVPAVPTGGTGRSIVHRAET